MNRLRHKHATRNQRDELPRGKGVSAWLRRQSAAILQIGLVLIGISLIYTFQTRDLLDASGEPAPPLLLSSLAGDIVDLQAEARPTLVYFFAPWCQICAASARNLRATRRHFDDSELGMLLVALDYASEAEVRDYVADHELDVPVLLGNPQVARDWQIVGFPTYYMIDSAGRVARKDFGYSTRLGLWWRARYTD
jgi:thiol-disulfide isomerase/thioredoxin